MLPSARSWSTCRTSTRVASSCTTSSRACPRPRDVCARPRRGWASTPPRSWCNSASIRRPLTGTTKMLAMVETADAFFRIHEIAKASPRLVALNLGAEDFALSAGMLPEADGLFMPKQVCVFAARAAGIMPLGFVGTVAEFHDLDGFRQTVRRSRRIGFVGGSVIHPSQVAILNEEFRPGAAEIDHASRVVAAYDKALAEGVGAVTVDGKMIDVPVVERAKLLLEREAAIAAREEKKRAAGLPPA